jgi:7-carboxy-7-deazaguanine synthase
MDEATEDLLEPHAKGKVKKLPIVEVFGPTVQGEGAIIGCRTTFIRFGLCDYKCGMCDSMHAVDPKLVRHNAKWMTPEEIVEELFKVQMHPDSPMVLNAEWVTFSGGNPCIHDLSHLIELIKAYNDSPQVKIAVETQGTVLPNWLHMCDTICVSPKGPGMIEQFEQNKFEAFLKAFIHHSGFYVKVVVFSAQDLEFARHINDLMRTYKIRDKMFLSLGNPYPPTDEGLKNLERDAGDDIASWDFLRLSLMRSYQILCEDLFLIPDLRDVRFLPQLHVLVWGNKQGV